MPRAPKSYYYAVRVGRHPGVYRSWDECKLMTQGFPGALFKKFRLPEEADHFMNGEGTERRKTNAINVDFSRFITEDVKPTIDVNAKPNVSQAVKPAMCKDIKPAIDEDVKPTICQDVKPAIDEDVKSLITSSAQSQKQNKQKIQANPFADIAPEAGETSDTLTIYTDGASSRNGQDGAVAGIGVYFGPDDPRNISEPLAGKRQTNQRAELTAIKRAIEHTLECEKMLCICTDSKYSINCLTNWFQKWEKNGWVRKGTTKDVDNKDIIEPTLALIRERNGRVRFIHVRGHAGVVGNEAADRLAVAGACKPPLR